MAKERTSPDTDSPAALVAIARAAKLAGDRDLQRAAKEKLRAEYGIELIFRRDHTIARPIIKKQGGGQ
jgi:hypothetical protein